MAVAEDLLKDPYFADLDIDLSQFSEEEKSVILGVMQKAKVSFSEFNDLLFSLIFLLNRLHLTAHCARISIFRQ